MRTATAFICSLVVVAALTCTCVSSASAGTWFAPPQDVSSAGSDASHLDTAMDGAGTVTAVWGQYTGGADEVFAARQSVSGSWSAPVNLDPTGFPAQAPVVASNAAGVTVAVWLENTVGSLNRLYAATYRADGTWSAPVAVSQAPSAPAGVYVGDMSVVVDPAGNATAVWTWDTGVNTTYYVYAARLPAGGTWSAPVALENTVTTERPRTVVDGTGVVTVLYDRDSGVSGRRIVVSRQYRGGAWEPEQVAWNLPSPNPSGLGAVGPAISVGPDGTVTALWSLEGTNVSEVWASQLRGGVWSSAVRVSTIGQAASSVDAATAADGSVIGIWQESSPSSPYPATISVSRFAAGTWSTPTALTAPDTVAGYINAGVGADQAGGVMAGWGAWDGVSSPSRKYVQQAAVFRDGQWGATTTLSTAGQTIYRGSYEPTVITAMGDAISVSWLRKNGSNNYVVQTERFADAPGAPTDVTVVPGETHATVSWKQPAFTIYPVQSYTVTAEPGGSTCTVTAPTLTCRVEKLTHGATYTFTVKATNIGGTGDPSAATPSIKIEAPAADGGGKADAFTVTATKVMSARRAGAKSIITTVHTPAAGLLTQKASISGKKAKKRGKGAVCTLTRVKAKPAKGSKVAKGKRPKRSKGGFTVSGAGDYTMTCLLTKAIRTKLRKRSVTVTLVTAFTATGGKPVTVSKSVKLKRRKVVRTAAALKTTLKVVGPGRITQTGIAPAARRLRATPAQLCFSLLDVNASGTYTIGCELTDIAKAMLLKGPLTIELTARFGPAGNGEPVVVQRTVTLAQVGGEGVTG